MRTGLQLPPWVFTATECEDGHSRVSSSSSKALCFRVACPTSSKKCIHFEVSLLRQGTSTLPPFSPTMFIDEIH